MAGSVIVAGARTPIGRLLGALKDFSGVDLGGFAIKAALQRAGVAPEQVEYVIMGHVLQAGAGQMTARQAAVAAGIPMTRAGADHQQGVPVRARRDRVGRPADPRRRVRDRRCRRHGVDDQRARTCCRSRAPGSSTATVDAGRLDGVRRAVGTFRPRAMGAADRARERAAGHHPRSSKTNSRRARISALRWPKRTGCSPKRSSRWPSRSGGAILCWSCGRGVRRHHG